MCIGLIYSLRDDKWKLYEDAHKNNLIGREQIRKKRRICILKMKTYIRFKDNIKHSLDFIFVFLNVLIIYPTKKETQHVELINSQEDHK